jgi:hypothetical protein
LQSQTITATPDSIIIDEDGKLESVRMLTKVIRDQVAQTLAFEYSGDVWVAGKLGRLFKQLRKDCATSRKATRHVLDLEQKCL